MKVWVNILNWPDFKKPVIKNNNAIGWINNRAYSILIYIKNLYFINKEITNKLYKQQKKANNKRF